MLHLILRHIKKLSIYHEIEEIIDLILRKTPYTVYFRPYPANLKSRKVIKIVNRYNHSKRFYLDESNDYTDQVYSRSKYLLTDISGTAITYTFFTNRKVIFYSRDENLIKKYYANNSYFKDRKKFGVIKYKPIE